MNRKKFLALGFALIVIIGVVAVAACQSTSTAVAFTASPTTVAFAASPTPSPTSLPPRPRPGYTPVPPDVVSPIVVQRSPERGEELPPEGIIEIVFDRAMNRKAVETAFSIAPDVEGKFEWADERTFRFRPAQELKRGELYDVALTQEAQAEDGAPLAEPYVFRFFTTGFLEVAQAVPADGTQDVEPTEMLFTVIFNRPVVPLTSLEEQAKLPQPLTLAPPVSGKGEWLNTSIYTFTPDEPLIGGKTYTARIKGGLTDTTGGLLAEDYTWSFSTMPPDVTWMTPNDGADLVPIETSITVQFNQPVDPESARQAFKLRDDRGETVLGDFGIVEDTLLFTPTKRLEFDREYRAVVKAGVTSIGGGEGMRQDRAWSFQAVPLPRIIGTEPADGDKDAHPYTDFTIYFNAPINKHTVMPNISMTPPLSPTQVHTYTSSRNTVFHLSFGAQPSTDYEVRIGPDIADPYGNKTGQKMTVRFRTAPLEPDLRLHIPDLIGTYNAYDPARLYVSYVNVKRADLKLYRLDDEEILYDQRDWYDYQPPRSGLIREWSQPLEAPLDKTSYAPIDLVKGGGRLEPGFYLLDATAPGVEYNRWGLRHLLVVSKLNLTLKTGERELLAWATDLSTGEPVGGVRLDFYESERHKLDTVTTGKDGVARVKLDRSGWSSVIALSTDPFAAVASGWSQGVSPWDFGLESEYDLREYNLHIYTERPIYRPGQKVSFKGVVRAEDDVRYSLPTGAEQVHVTVMAPDGEEVYDEMFKLSEFATFDGELTLAEGASLGDYSLTASFRQRYFSTSFQVAAYRPPEFEVLVKPDKPEITRDEKTGATVEVQYFFGGPVADAPVQWNVLAESFRFKPPWGGRYKFTDTDDPWICFDCWWYRPEPPQPVLSGSGVTDEQGRLTIEIPADLQVTARNGEPAEGSVWLTIEATVTGRDNQVISGRESVIAHRGDFYVGLAPQKYVSKEGQPTAVDLVAVDWEGTRLPRKEIKVSFYHREWINTFVENEVGGGRWERETKDTLVDTVTATTDGKGEAVASFTPPSGGAYHVVAESVDSGGRKVRSSLFIWVAGEKYVSWRRENHDRITLIADKSSYLPGETAEILIPSPYEGPHKALLTIERGGILHHEVIEMTSNSQVYRLPITADHVPNIYVSVVLVKGQKADDGLADYKVGYVPLEVQPVLQTLQVKLTPDRDKAGPGEPVTYQLEATDADGQPVQAEFSLDLVDKAVLSLQPRQPEAIVQTFYGRQGLGIQTASGLAVSVNRYLQELEKELGMDKARAAEGKGGGPQPTAAPVPEAPMAMEEAPMEKEMAAAEPGLPPGIEVREEFADTAYWNAAIVTDRSGKASVTVELPDNLTTWVMRGVGLTVDTRVGEGTGEVVATKPLLVRPIAPRFFVVGDRARLGAAVNNNTDGPLDVEIMLSAKGVEMLDEASQTVKIEAGKEAKVNWDVVVSDVTQAELIFAAVSGEYSDASKPRLATGPDGSLLVLRYSAPEMVGTGGQLVEAGARTEVVALPPRYDERRGELSVQIDPSLAAGMRDGLDYLEHYPYECVEQVVSRFLPNVMTYRALRELGISDPELESRLPGLVEIGVDKLVRQQNDDGGWGWWAMKESNPYLSAYVLFGLLKAQQADFAVPDDTIDRAVLYLYVGGHLVSAQEIDSYHQANKQAFILYVLAEAGTPGGSAVDELFERRDKLHHYGKAFLALTIGMDNPRDERIKTLLSDLNNAAILSATGAHWEEDGYDWWAMNTDTRSTAVILDALARLDKDNALVPNVVRWLMVARKEGIWETTQETAWALIALTDWMVVTGELKAEYDYAVILNEEELAAGNVTEKNVGESVKLKVAVADLLRDVGNRLTVEKGRGPGRLYYTAHLRVFLPVEEIEAIDRGVIVSRRYTLASCDKGSGCPEVREARVGDVIRVDLTIIAPHDLYYVVVEDPLPAGAEAIDPSLATTSLLELHPSLTSQVGKPYWEDFYYWWWNWYSRSELRDEKVVLFADYLYKGTYQFSYTMRATLPGDYHVMPTVASEFYFPEVFGRSDGRLLSIGGE